MKNLLWMFILLWPVGGWGAHLMMVPPAVNAGEVAWIRWEGPELSVGAVRFDDRVIPLQKRGERWEALFGVDVDTEPGTYPMYVVASLPTGHSYNLRVDLTVRGVQRPVERLTLPEGMVTPKSPEVLERIANEHKLLTALWDDWSGPLQAGTFSRPVDEPVSSVFGKRRILNGVKKTMHSGTDFRSPAGTPIRSPGAGRVVLVTDLFYTGLTVIVDHGGGLFSLMAHLSESQVAVGDTVKEGTPLGRVGSSGRSTGPHLHWTVRIQGNRVDPLSVVKAFAGESP